MKSSLVNNVITKPWFAFVIITIVGLVVYSNIYRVPFVFDGVHQIENKVNIRDLKNYFSPRVLFWPRPLVEFTFALNYKFGELNVFGYHLINVLIHIINGILVYFLAQTIFKELLIPPTQRFGHSNSPKSKDRSPRSNVRGSQSAISQSTIDNRQSSIHLMSLFTALIFVAHPIQTQAVTYTAQRYTSMAAMFYFLSILCYVKARLIQQRAESRGLWAVDSGQWSVVRGHPSEMRFARHRNEFHGVKRAPRLNPLQGALDRAIQLGREVRGAFSFQLSAYFALAFLCGVLAFLSKQNTASLPGAILLVEYLLFDRTWQGWKRKLLWFAPFFVLMGVFILYVSGLSRGGVQIGSLLEDVSDILRAPETEVSRWIYLCTQFDVVTIYMRLLFFPVGQNLDWFYPFKSGFFDGYTPAAFLFLIALVGIGIWQIKKRPAISFGILWIFITLSVESTIFPIKDALFEHRLYLPMFGFAVMVAYMVFCLLPVKQLWHIVISILIILSFGSSTLARNRTYQNGVMLWSDVVSKSPLNFRAYYNLGNALYKSKRMEEAIKSHSEALRIKQDFAGAHLNLGVVLMEMGRLDNAISHLSEAMRIKPGDALIHNNLGNALRELGRLQNAVLHLSEAIRIAPKFAEAHNNLGIALAQQGNLKDAMVHFSEALRIEPHSAKIYSNLGQAFMLQGDLPRAAHHYSEAVRINPGYAEAHFKLGVILVRQGDVDGGIEHFSKALKIKPGMNEARQGMNRALRLKDLKNPPYR